MAEKARNISRGIFGIIFGIIEIIIAVFVIYFGIHFNMMASEVAKSPYLPYYYPGLVAAVSYLILFGGIYLLVHAIKRIIDQVFMVYLSAKTSG